jgi:hypothetical protein
VRMERFANYVWARWGESMSDRTCGGCGDEDVVCRARENAGPWVCFGCFYQAFFRPRLRFFDLCIFAIALPLLAVGFVCYLLEGRPTGHCARPTRRQP